jgi:PKD repeat protein
VTSGQAPLAVNFTGSNSTDSDGTIVSYAWNFGGGNSASTANANHIYAAAGTFNAVLTVTDDDGDTDTAQITITVTEPGGGDADVEIAGSWIAGLNHAAAAGSNRALILLAHVEHEGVPNLTAVTYGGQPMTKVIDRTQGTTFRAYTAAFLLNEAGIAAATSSSFNPTWSENTSENPGYSSVFLINVDQSLLTGASASNGSNNQATISTTALSTQDGDMVIVSSTSGNTGSYSVNNGFTEAVEHSIVSSDGVDGYKSATGANETPSVTQQGANRQSIIGFVVRHATSAQAANATPGISDEQGDTQKAGLSIDASEPQNQIPDRYALNSAYPNPFNPGTHISFSIANRDIVHLKIYDLTGRLTRTLVRGEELSAGIHKYFWDGRDEHGQSVSSGIYIIQMRTKNFSAATKTTLIK